jgi:hypothetical protein
MPAPLIEFPADDPERALRFWAACSGRARAAGCIGGSGWEAKATGSGSGCTERGTGPATPAPSPTSPSRTSAPRWSEVRELGGSVIHPGERWAICRDSEGSPFALAAATPGRD